MHAPSFRCFASFLRLSGTKWHWARSCLLSETDCPQTTMWRRKTSRYILFHKLLFRTCSAPMRAWPRLHRVGFKNKRLCVLCSVPFVECRMALSSLRCPSFHHADMEDWTHFLFFFTFVNASSNASCMLFVLTVIFVCDILSFPQPTFHFWPFHSLLFFVSFPCPAFLPIVSCLLFFSAQVLQPFCDSVYFRLNSIQACLSRYKLQTNWRTNYRAKVYAVLRTHTAVCMIVFEHLRHWH